MKFIALPLIVMLLATPAKAGRYDEIAAKCAEETSAELSDEIKELTKGVVIDEYGYSVSADAYMAQIERDRRRDELFQNKVFPVMFGIIACVPNMGVIAGIYLIARTMGEW